MPQVIPSDKKGAGLIQRLLMNGHSLVVAARMGRQAAGKAFPALCGTRMHAGLAVRGCRVPRGSEP
jgi:hypothetical protein